MPDSSPLGVPAALTLMVAFVLFVAAMGVLDYLIIRARGVNYSMTYGMRWLYVHEPFGMVTFMLLLGGLVFSLVMHFAGGQFSQ